MIRAYINATTKAVTRAVIPGSGLNQIVAQYQTVLDAMTEQPSATLITLQNDFAKTLVDAGIWAKGDRLFVMDNHTNDNGEALLNWINPAQSATNHGATHYPYCGMTPDGSTTYIDSGFNPTTAGQKFAQNDATFLTYSRKRIYAHIGGGTSAGYTTNSHGGQYDSSAYNNSNIALHAASSKYDGFIATTRNSSTVVSIFNNDIKVSGNKNSATPNNVNFYICGGLNNNGTLSNQNNGSVSISFIGSYLTDEQIEIFRVAINTYINGIDNTFKLLPSPIASVNVATKQKLTIPTYVVDNDEVVHPSVVNCGSAWNGYQYWMAITPYPNANDDYENPSIFASSDGLEWVVPSGLTNPVVPAVASPYYNADPFLYFETDTLYLGWMESTAPQKIWMMKSTDGINWTDKTQLISVSDGYYNSYTAIGSMVKVGSTYYLYYFGHGIGTQKSYIMRKSCSTPMGTYSSIPENIDFVPPPKLDWYHFSVKYYNGKFYIIANTTANTTKSFGDYIYIGVSDDGLHFKKYDAPLISKTETIEDKFYMPTFCQIGTGLRVYYSISNYYKWELMTAEMTIN